MLAGTLTRHVSRVLVFGDLPRLRNGPRDLVRGKSCKLDRSIWRRDGGVHAKARAETTRVEAWKVQELRARENFKLQAKQAKLNAHRAKLQGKGPPKPAGPFLQRRERISASNLSLTHRRCSRI